MKKLIRFVSLIMTIVIPYMWEEYSVYVQVRNIEPVEAHYREQESAAQRLEREEMYGSADLLTETESEENSEVLENREAGQDAGDSENVTAPRPAEIGEVEAKEEKRLSSNGTEGREEYVENPEEKPGDPEERPENSEGKQKYPDENKEHPSPVTMNGFLLDEDRMIVGVNPEEICVEDGYLELPDDGCVGIRNGAFASYEGQIVEIYIPGNITVIEEGAFCGISGLEWLDIDSACTQYAGVDGVIYDADMSTLIAFPSARTGTFEVPGTVTRIGDKAMYHTRLEGLDMRKCGEIQLGNDIFGGETGEEITIHVSAQWEEFYRNLFIPYRVRIIGYGQ